MKKLLIILLCLPLFTLAQHTYVPDDDFEQHLINEGYDNVLDDSVQTSAIDTVSALYLGFFISNISDLTGLEDFALLKNLSISPSLNLTTLDVSQNILLEFLSCYGNNLTTLDVSNNTALTSLNCWGNQLTNLDVSQNTALTDLNCGNNPLTSLDVRNGNNTNFIDFVTVNNPNLSCINVDDFQYSSWNWTYIDPQHYFSNNCTPTSIQEHTTNKELLKVTDLLGRETKQTNQPLFYIYDNGTVEKRIVIE